MLKIDETREIQCTRPPARQKFLRSSPMFRRLERLCSVSTQNSDFEMGGIETDLKVPVDDLIKAVTTHTVNPYRVQSESHYLSVLQGCKRRVVVQRAMKERALSKVRTESSAFRIKRAITLYEASKRSHCPTAVLPNVNAFMGEIVKYQSRGDIPLLDVFRQLDNNGDGKLSYQELLLCSKKLGLNMSTDDAQGMMQMLDKNGDGEVEFEEVRDFIKHCRKRLLM